MPAETSETAERSGPIAGILLAAGTSSRMGSNKMLFELDGESVLRGAARRAVAGGLSPLIVVLGHQRERAKQELAGLPCQVAFNPDYEEGITSSLRAGLSVLETAEPDVQGAMVMLADMPYVTKEMIAAMIARYRGSRAPLVVSDYEGVHAPPMLYDRALFEELMAMTESGCGKQVVKRHRHEAEVLAWPAEALSDLDLPEDYARVKGAQ
ncbi:MAG TPA: nucleotidyltransferase family protein [Thermoanaerobaculia bacterium]|nr:nucleotidyltransferase family protein [Thermoanaerobaculia bacterium]